MIYIKKETNNKIVRRFNDLKTLTNPFFLWELKREDTKEVIFFSMPDTSDSPEAYNLFELNESMTGSTSGGANIPLNLKSGQYEYRVFESTTPTLNISGTTGVAIERNMLVVEMKRTVNDSGATQNNIYY